MKKTKSIGLLGAPVDYGSRLRGCLMGPDAMRVANVVETIRELDYDVVDFGNLAPKAIDRIVKPVAGVHNLQDAAAWTESLKAKTEEIADAGHLPIILGGDHSMALGSVPGICAYAETVNRPVYVLWLDAHTDFNTFETSASGNIHGMPVSFFCGLPGFEQILGGKLQHTVNPENIFMMGIRSVDPNEKQLICEYGVTVHDMRAIDEHGIVAPLRDFLTRVEQNNGLLHVSFDVDFLDPAVAPAVGTTVPGGATVREAHLIMELVYDSGLLSSLEVAELNPALDHSGKTAQLLVDLIASALGRRVLER